MEWYVQPGHQDSNFYNDEKNAKIMIRLFVNTRHNKTFKTNQQNNLMILVTNLMILCNQIDDHMLPTWRSYVTNLMVIWYQIDDPM